MVRRVLEANPRTEKAWNILVGGVGVISSIPWERLVFSTRRGSRGSQGTSSPTTSAKSPQPLRPARSIDDIEGPTTEETIAWQRRQIAKELYNLQMNLAAGGMIAGKPCDCLSGKHVLGLEALAEETMAMHQDPLYQKVLDWTKEVDSRGTPEAIASGKYKGDYPRMAQEARAFRKRLLGTADTRAMMTEQEREEVLNRAKSIARVSIDGLVEKELEVQGGSD